MRRSAGNRKRGPGCVFSGIVLLFVSIIDSPTHAAPSFEQFAKQPDLMQVEISPDGRYLAQLWNRANDNMRILTVSDLSKADLPIVGTITDDIRRPSSVSWANDERLLVNFLIPMNTERVIRQSQRKEDFDINDYFMFQRTIAMDVNARNFVTLLNGEPGLKRNINLSIVKHYLPDDPQHILMPAQRSGVLVLYKVNIYTGEAEMLVRGDSNTYAFLSDEKGKPLYRLDYRPFKKQIEIYQQDEREKWRKISQVRIEDIEEFLNLSDGNFVGISGEKLVYHRLNKLSGYMELVLFDPDTESIETLASESGRDILYPILSIRSEDFVGYGVDGDVIRNRFFDKDVQAEYENIARQVGDRYFHITSATRDADRSVVHVHSPDNPTAYNIYYAKTGKLEFLANSYFDLAAQELSSHEKIVYQARDGQEITAYTLLPQNYKPGERLPLVILPHGGPQGRDRSVYDDFAQFISTRGYIVIQPNFRGSTGYGKAFEEAGYKQWGQLMQDDLTDAVEHMIKQGYVDRSRVCIVGISYGGYAALMGAIRTPDLYRCSVSINGVTQLQDMIAKDARQIDDDGLVEQYLYDRIGHPRHDKEILEENSPMLQAKKINIPVLLIAGTEDQSVPFSQSKNMAKALKKYKKQHRLVRLEDTGHNPFAFHEDIETVYTEVEAFLAQHLSPGQHVSQQSLSAVE